MMSTFAYAEMPAPVRPCMDGITKYANLCDPERCQVHRCTAWERWAGQQKRGALRRWATEAVEAELAAPALDPDDPLFVRPSGWNGKRAGCSSRYRGVMRSKNGWRSIIWINGEAEYLGYFQDERQAAMAYNDAVMQYGLPAWKLNHIEEDGNG